jgi:hypothetical protein
MRKHFLVRIETRDFLCKYLWLAKLIVFVFLESFCEGTATIYKLRGICKALAENTKCPHAVHDRERDKYYCMTNRCYCPHRK